MELNPGPIVPPPDIPTVKRKIRVLSLFDGIATGCPMLLLKFELKQLFSVTSFICYK